MATFDLQHFFDTRQELASRTGSLYAQRAVADMRESLRAKQIEAKSGQAKAAPKVTKKATRTESEGGK